MVALPVSISASTSPSDTLSPSCLSQRAMVPSSIVSPRRGITTSSATSTPLEQHAALAQHAAGGGLDLVLQRRGGELERLRVRHRRLGPADPLDRRVEVVEAG